MGTILIRIDLKINDDVATRVAQELGEHITTTYADVLKRPPVVFVQPDLDA